MNQAIQMDVQSSQQSREYKEKKILKPSISVIQNGLSVIPQKKPMPTNSIHINKSQQRVKDKKKLKKQKKLQKINKKAMINSLTIVKNQKHDIQCFLCHNKIDIMHYQCIICSKNYHKYCLPIICLNCSGIKFIERLSKNILAPINNQTQQKLQSKQIEKSNNIIQLPKVASSKQFSQSDKQSYISPKTNMQKKKNKKNISLIDEISFFPPSISFQMTHQQYSQKNKKGQLFDITNITYPRSFLQEQSSAITKQEAVQVQYVSGIFNFIREMPQFIKRYKTYIYIVFPIPQNLLQKYTIFSSLINNDYFGPSKIPVYSVKLTKTFNVAIKIWSMGHILKDNFLHNSSLFKVQQMLQIQSDFPKVLTSILQIYFQQINFVKKQKDHSKYYKQMTDNYQFQAECRYQKLNSKYHNIPPILKVIAHISQLGHLYQIMIYLWPKIVLWFLQIYYMNIKIKLKPFQKQKIIELMTKLNKANIGNGKITVNLDLMERVSIIQYLIQDINLFNVFQKNIRACMSEQLPIVLDQMEYEQKRQKILSEIQQKQKLLKQIKDKQIAINIQIHFKKIIAKDNPQNCQLQLINNLQVQSKNNQCEMQKMRSKIKQITNNLYALQRQNLYYQKQNQWNFYDKLKMERFICLGKDHRNYYYWYADGHPQHIFINSHYTWRLLSYSNIKHILKNLCKMSINQNKLISRIQWLQDNNFLGNISTQFRCFCGKTKNEQRVPQIQTQISDILQQGTYFKQICKIMMQCVNNVTEYLTSIGMIWGTERQIIGIRESIEKFQKQGQNINYYKNMNKQKTLIEQLKKMILEFHNKIINYHPNDVLSQANKRKMRIWNNSIIKNAWIKSLNVIPQQFTNTRFCLQKYQQLFVFNNPLNGYQQLYKIQQQILLLAILLSIRIKFIKVRGESKLLINFHNHKQGLPRIGQKQSDNSQSNSQEDQQIDQYIPI